MLRGRAIQAWDVPEMNQIGTGITSLANNEYLSLEVHDTSEITFPFAFPLIQASDAAHQFLRLYLIVGVSRSNR